MCDAPVTGTLYEHQRTAYARALETFTAKPGYGHFMEMGCGKTLTAIAIMGRVFLDNKIEKVLVVAPASVCPVWPMELGKYADYPYRCTVLTGAMDKRGKELKSLIPRRQRELLVAVINYEATWRLEPAISAWWPDMIICDESQRIKSGTARQSKAMHRLAARAAYRMILTGTPIANSPLDLWSQYRFLDPAVFGTSFMAFRGRYAVMGGMRINGRAVQVVAYKHLDELTDKAYAIASRVTKADALDLPPKVFEVRPVPLTDTERKVYRAMQRDSLVNLGGQEVTATIVLTRMMRLQQITGGFLRGDGAEQYEQVTESKLKALRDIIEDTAIDAGAKLVVYARFVPEIVAICTMLDKLFTRPKDSRDPQLTYSCIYGAVAQVDRAEAVSRFQDDPNCRVFVGQTEAACEGITLTAASCMVFYSLDFSFMRYAQAQDRIHRIGQGHSCTYIHLVCPNTIDEQVLAALNDKRDLAVSVIDDGWKRLFEEETPCP